MLDLSKMTTETRNNKTMELDTLSALEIVSIMNEEDLNVVAAVKKELPSIAKIVESATAALRKGGRIIYMGAGTSGRLGLLDAVECPPTFGVSPNVVVGLLAGGVKAFVKAVEGAEDSLELGVDDLKEIELNKNDIVIGIAASGRTPYVIGGLRYAKSVGAVTATVSCNKNAAISKEADIVVEIDNGAEVLTGSTRLKSGTSQKMICNMITTASMVGFGKVYKNLMVDVMQTNEKLVVRAENIVMTATEVEREVAKEMLKAAGGSVKLAITMILLNTDAKTATNKLLEANGHIRKAIK